MNGLQQTNSLLQLEHLPFSWIIGLGSVCLVLLVGLVTGSIIAIGVAVGRYFLTQRTQLWLRATDGKVCIDWLRNLRDRGAGQQ
jgi:uncharacterized membrane protein YGL010W